MNDLSDMFGEIIRNQKKGEVLDLVIESLKRNDKRMNSYLEVTITTPIEIRMLIPWIRVKYIAENGGVVEIHLIGDKPDEFLPIIESFDELKAQL